MHENAKDLTYEQCMKVIKDMEAIKSAQEKKGKKGAKKTGAKKSTTKKTTKTETAEA
jgi:DNA topoisomerase-1